MLKLSAVKQRKAEGTFFILFDLSTDDKARICVNLAKLNWVSATKMYPIPVDDKCIKTFEKVKYLLHYTRIRAFEQSRRTEAVDIVTLSSLIVGHIDSSNRRQIKLGIYDASVISSRHFLVCKVAACTSPPERYHHSSESMNKKYWTCLNRTQKGAGWEVPLVLKPMF